MIQAEQNYIFSAVQDMNGSEIVYESSLKLLRGKQTAVILVPTVSGKTFMLLKP